MTRREWLERVFGAVVAATVAPLVDLTDTTLAFWDQPAIQRLWRVTFPDGTTFSFHATVLAEKILDDDGAQLTLRPVGDMKASQEIAFPIRFAGEPADDRKAEPVPSPHAPATVLSTTDGRVVEVLDVSLPALERHEFAEFDDGEHQHHLQGLKRQSALTFTVKF